MSGERTNTDSGTDWSRRTLLKTTGVGAGIAALAGASLAGATQDDGMGDGNETVGGNETDAADSTHFLGDLIDPTFGYPLAAGEGDDLDLDHVVEAYTEEGEGAHEGFPAVPEMGDFPYEFAFDPVGIHVEPGELVHFENTAGDHTVTAAHEKWAATQLDLPMRVPEGTPGFTSPPMVDGESWVYAFEQEGVYDLVCLPHYSFGMVMRVVVTETDDGLGAPDGTDGMDGGNETEDEGVGGNATDGDLSAPEAGPLPPNAAAVLGAEELDPQNVVDSGTVAWDELTLDPPEPPVPEDGAGANESIGGNASDE